VQSHFIKKKKYLTTDSISAEVFDIAKENKAKAIVVDSISGLTARLISRYRPETYIAVITDDAKTLNKMALTWGTYAYYLQRCKNLDELIKKSVNLVKREKIVKKRDKIIVVTGQPVGRKKGMNLIKVQEI
jgi:pyruvate kinase